ncbi:unnamed protein product, partial [Cylicostephanus goldi]
PRFSALTPSPLSCSDVRNGFDRPAYFPPEPFAPSLLQATPRIQRGPLIGPVPPVNPLFAMVPPTTRAGAIYPPLQPPGERLCMVSVAIGPGRVFTGIGSTFAQAKANAAAQCLGYLGPHIQALDAKLKLDEQRRKASLQKSTSEEGMTNGTTEGAVEHAEGSADSENVPKHKQKSVISQVHECALQMKLNVEFEVVKEVGPPHDRSYVVRCSLRNPKNEVLYCLKLYSRRVDECK